MSNHAAQENLVSLSSIGLLAYITSLPEDWTLHKTFLQNKFTRRTVDSAWNELLEKKYIAGFSMYVDRKKQYYYLASDEELTQEEFNDFVEETFYEVHEQTEFVPKNLQIIKGNRFNMEFDFESEIAILSDVRLVQYNKYSTISTEQDEQIQIPIQKEISKRNNKKEVVNKKDTGMPVDKNEFFKIVNNFDQCYYTDQEWNTITAKLFEETLGKEIYNLEKYVTAALTTICNRRKPKTYEHISRPVPFYNWLEDRS